MQQESQPVLLCQQSKGASQDTVQGPACALPAPGRAEHLCLACQALVAGGVCRQRVTAHEWCQNLTVGEPWRAQPICPHSVHQQSELRQLPAESLCTWREKAFKPSSSSREKTGGSCSALTWKKGCDHRPHVFFPSTCCPSLSTAGRAAS